MKWIRCSERLPEPDQRVLVYLERGGMTFAIFRQERHDEWVTTRDADRKRTQELKERVETWWEGENQDAWDVTHWAPLEAIEPPLTGDSER